MSGRLQRIDAGRRHLGQWPIRNDPVQRQGDLRDNGIIDRDRDAATEIGDPVGGDRQINVVNADRDQVHHPGIHRRGDCPPGRYQTP